MSLLNQRYVAVDCELALGGFSGERVFKVKLANGESYSNIAPRHYCWNASGVLVGDGEPSEKSSGKVAARIVSIISEIDVAVEVPSGDVLAVEKSRVSLRPSEIRPPEPKQHVSIR